VTVDAEVPAGLADVLMLAFAAAADELGVRSIGSARPADEVEQEADTVASLRAQIAMLERENRELAGWLASREGLSEFVDTSLAFEVTCTLCTARLDLALRENNRAEAAEARAALLAQSGRTFAALVAGRIRRSPVAPPPGALDVDPDQAAFYRAGWVAGYSVAARIAATTAEGVPDADL
jgi:hypothetical protein